MGSARRVMPLDKIEAFGESFASSVARGSKEMDGYKLATYQASDGPRAGLVIDDKVFNAAKLTGKSAYASVLGILEDWRTAKGVLRKAAAAAKKSRVKASPLERTKLLAPVRWPSAIYCAGANYADHGRELDLPIHLLRQSGNLHRRAGIGEHA